MAKTIRNMGASVSARLLAIRLRTTARVGRSRINVVIDIGFGDAVEPGLEEVEVPVLLDQPAPRLRAYDIWILSRTYDFAGDRLARAMGATFQRRKTDLPMETPDALTREFAQDPAKRQQWDALLRDVSGQAGPLEDVIRDLAEFLMPHAKRARK